MVLALERDSVEVVLVGLGANDVDGLMLRNLRMLAAVILLILSQDSVVRNFHEIDFDVVLLLDDGSFRKILNFWIRFWSAKDHLVILSCRA